MKEPELEETEVKTSGKGLNKTLLISIMLFVLTVGVLIGTIITAGGRISQFFTDLTSKDEVEVIIPLEEFLINLSPGEENTDRYLQIEVSLYSSEEGTQELIESNDAKIRDAIINVLRKQTSDSLFQEEEDSLILKTQLKDEINEALGETAVTDIFITNIVMQ